ncbi:unnamed protein product, partial [Chrysoparadoxa australica]
MQIIKYRSIVVGAFIWQVTLIMIGITLFWAAVCSCCRDKAGSKESYLFHLVPQKRTEWWHARSVNKTELRRREIVEALLFTGNTVNHGCWQKLWDRMNRIEPDTESATHVREFVQGILEKLRDAVVAWSQGYMLPWEREKILMALLHIHLSIVCQEYSPHAFGT